uniref:hypothetical protein n=1 Tax=Xanthomonas euvesicatoria TaxID=456327 RepID=UPI00226B3EBF|nr:hypothetical protein [Xanthomonas euvesicatoria]
MAWAQHPDIARARDRRLANLRQRILIGLPLVVRLVARDQFRQRVGVEAGDVEVEAFQLQGFQFDAQHRVVPTRVLGDAVVRDDQGAALRWRQVIQHDHRHDLQPEFLGGGQASVTSNDDAVAARQDRIGESELGDAGGDLRHLLLGVGARVAGVGQQLGCRPLLDLVGQPVHAITSMSEVAARSAATCSKD